MKMVTKLELTKEELEHFNYVLKMFKLLTNTAIDDVISDELCEENYCSIICEYLEDFRTVIDGTVRRNIE